jgi:hypothetical protein
MKFALHDVRSADDRETFQDVNLFPNSYDGTKVIITCTSKENRELFMEGFEKLLKRYTIESLHT